MEPKFTSRKGVGRPGALTVLTLVCSWGIMIPCSYMLAFPAHWGLAGLWIGPCIGEVFKLLSLGALLYSYDWSVLAREAAARSESD